MATFKWEDGNQQFDPNVDFRDFGLDTFSTTGATLTYDAGGYDPTQHAWRIELTFSDVVEYTFEQGPDAGEKIFTSGSITGAQWFNQSDELILSATELDVDLAYATAFANYRDLDDFFINLREIFRQQDNVYKGSADSMAPGWDGDDIFTGYGQDTVKAGKGNDFITDYYGKDEYNGGKGWDTLSYDESFWVPHLAIKGIKVDLSEGKITGYDGMVDTVKNIEGVRGTFKKDSFIGDKNDNHFMGLQGKDVIDGGKGFDIASYRRDALRGGTDGIKADLKEGIVIDGFGHNDKVKNIEGIQGTDTNDVFVDNKKRNGFDGRDGDDLFTFGKGNDWVSGGSGADTFRFKSTFDLDTIRDFEDGIDRIQIAGVSGWGDLTVSEDGDDTVIMVGDVGGNQLRLENFDSSDISGADFIFGAFV